MTIKDPDRADIIKLFATTFAHYNPHALITVLAWEIIGRLLFGSDSLAFSITGNVLVATVLLTMHLRVSHP